MLNFVFLKTKKKHKKLEFALFNTSYDDTQGSLFVKKTWVYHKPLI